MREPITMASEVIYRMAKPRTDDHGETCRSKKPTANGRQPTVLVLIAEIGGNNAENEGTSERRHLIMVC